MVVLGSSTGIPYSALILKAPRAVPGVDHWLRGCCLVSNCPATLLLIDLRITARAACPIRKNMRVHHGRGCDRQMQTGLIGTQKLTSRHESNATNLAMFFSLTNYANCPK